MSQIKKIDYLTEDEPIPSQKLALITIVGPNMKQKCDVWGIKVRGVCDSLESAKALTKKIMKFDKDYDIYTVEVGKFVPLAVEHTDVKNVEYENEQLNTLVQSYLENKEQANELWSNRKDEMMKDAIREGREQKEQTGEHPVAVLQRMNTFESKIQELQEQLNNMTSDLSSTRDKFNSYTDEERQFASEKLNEAKL